MGKISRSEYLASHRGHRWAVAIAATGLVLFQLYTGLFGSFDALLQRSIHLGFGLVLVFLVKPSRGGKEPGLRDAALVLASLAAIFYILLSYDWIAYERFCGITPLSLPEKILSIVAILLVAEGTRRVAGKAMVFVIIAFFVYLFTCQYLPGILYAVQVPWTDFLDFQYLGTAGIFGTPLGVSATDIALFIVFGATIMQCGGAELINALGSCLTRSTKGGPAKLAVVVSALMGTISGSGTANVVTTGSVTIPMMKRAGYRPAFAGAVEAVSSTGGQIMPPVMGVGAFLMAALSGIPYITICKYSVFPAILYFLGVFFAVHLEAVHSDLGTLKQEVDLKDTLSRFGHLLIPILLLVVTLVLGFSPTMAAGVGVVSVLVLSQIRASTRMNLWDILTAFEGAAKSMLIVIMATAAAGMIVGVIETTGLGQRLAAGLVHIAAGRQFIGLILGMVLAIVLGMGMPTSAAYIIQASTVIPAFIDMGVPIHVAHLFAFYYACLSLITPPVAITSYAASAIAQSDMWRTGWIAFRLGLPAYIIPFMFVYGQSLLLEGGFLEILLTVVTSAIGVFFLSVSTVGFLLHEIGLPGRVAAFVAALLLIAPSAQTALPGAAIGVALVLWSAYARRAEKAKRANA